MPYAAQYPAMVDVEPTLNEHARQTVLKGFADKRKAVRQAELKREKARKSAVKTVVASRSTTTVRKSYVYEATYYTAFCSTGCIGITASGHDVSNTETYNGMRIVAAPVSIPLYSILRVHTAEETYVAIVLDRGGDITAGRLDILVADKRTALNNGRHSVTVEILRNGAD